MRKKIGIVGYGYLGQAFEHAFYPKCDIKINDPKFEVNGVKFFDKKQLFDCDLILVGVPTPYSKSNGVDISILDSVLCELNTVAKDNSRDLLLCIKSAFPPSFCETFRNKYKNLRLTASPEYLSGKDNIRDMINHEVLIVGGDNMRDCWDVIELFKDHSVANKDVKADICSFEEACLIKYMENAFLAMKCVFMSEFYKLHQAIEAPDKNEFNEVIRLWQFDSRMGNYPYQIPYKDDPLGFCSHCLCKDQRAIRDEAMELGVNLDLMEAMHTINEVMRSEKEDGHCRCEKTAGGVVD